LARTLNIAVDARPLSYPLTGIGNYVKFLLEALQQQDQSNNYFLISNGPIRFDPANPRWTKIEGSITKKLLSTLWMQVFGPLAVIRNQIDLFWSPRHHLPILLPPRTPAILTIHDLTHRFYPETMARANLWVERLLMPVSARRAQRVVTDARATARDLADDMHIPAAKIRVVAPGPPSLPDEKDRPGAPDTLDLPKDYFLFVGTLDPRKNFSGLFAAFAELNPDENNLHLVIVGGAGWKNDHFHSMLKGHPAATHLHFTGYVPRRQLRKIYQDALALVFPSLYEGFGFPILEAMAAGTPVITSDRSSLPEVAGEGAILVDPHDTAALTRAMEQVRTSPQLRRELIDRGHRQLRIFTWEKAARHMQTMFYEVAGP